MVVSNWASIGRKWLYLIFMWINGIMSLVEESLYISLGDWTGAKVLADLERPSLPSVVGEKGGLVGFFLNIDSVGCLYICIFD